ncbi:MAG: hypothetical protein CYPHOPRED_002735 [Cyphobasidiales sp. Tagirdzhanova-0007]|nr:MAG: hypothetical protein CYPHOPRED_002735 [Cyphobasidiales sp. Tagirdzhanova-0007]
MPPLFRAGRIPRRCFASFSDSDPVSLAYDLHRAPSSGSTRQGQGPLVILHGLYGSKQNWRSLSKALAQATGRNVYALDLRNHGTSPHSEGSTYRDYAKDVSRFFETEKLSEVVLMGHSMGGKVAMSQALLEPDSLARLISVDMSPAKGKISPDFVKYIEGMREVQKTGVKSKKEADVILQKFEESLAIRQFLLTNFVQSARDTPFSFRLPLDILQRSIDDIGDFPYDPDDGVSFDKPTLFIKGGESKYINRKNVTVAEKLFPNRNRSLSIPYTSALEMSENGLGRPKPNIQANVEAAVNLRYSAPSLCQYLDGSRGLPSTSVFYPSRPGICPLKEPFG